MEEIEDTAFHSKNKFQQISFTSKKHCYGKKQNQPQRTNERRTEEEMNSRDKLITVVLST